MEEEKINFDYLRLVCWNLPVFVLTVNSEGKIYLVNDSLIKVLGYREEELVNQSVDLVFTEGGLVKEVFAKGILENYITIYLNKKGEKIPVVLNARLIKNNGVLGILFVAREIEELKQICQVYFPQVAKLVSLGELTASVAHELNNPLQVILGNIQLLVSELPRGEDSYVEAKEIEEAAQRCRRIVSNLLEFSRQKEYGFVSAEINKVIDQAIDLALHKMEISGIEIVRNYEKNLPSVPLSLAQIQEVFINILLNAVQAMPQGGRITISTSFMERSIPGRDSLGMKNENIQICFEDTGIGIEKKNLNRIFEPFFTTREKGTGLGLSVSYEIIRRHQGTIFAESEGLGKGAKFVIQLPVETRKKNG
ncbi:MAG TPA: hypothetical protein DHV62_04060 [Elusimicrobia bacterium]|jgi:PAS domain S-box-containing protein|nr:hypothetical protein [Elusimicrobiota bacterium]